MVMEEDQKMNSSIINTVILQQLKRINELEAELRRSRGEIRRLQTGCRARNDAVSVASVDSRVDIVQGPGRTEKTKPQPHGKLSDTSNQTRYWTADEHARFLEGCSKHGPRNYSAVSAHVGTRTPKQVRTHAQKYEVRIEREANAKKQRLEGATSVASQPAEDQSSSANAAGKSSAVSIVSLESVTKEESVLDGEFVLHTAEQGDAGDHEAVDENINFDMFDSESGGAKPVKDCLVDEEFSEDWFLNMSSNEGISEKAS